MKEKNAPPPHPPHLRTLRGFSLYMCMGFGCNAVGVTGCRIVDSRRERLIAMLTNALVPCNGRFPTLIALISLFFVTGSGAGASFFSALLLAGVILLAVAMTLLCSRLLSDTVLRGTPSAFTLELPPYRTPQVGKIIVRSLLDRTLFVLGRAVAVAAPAGLLLWILANIPCGDTGVLQRLAAWLDPIGNALGMDGTVLLAFFLALPAAEIVMPVILMTYTAGGSLMETENLMQMKEVLTANGWTAVTALCVLLFMLFHFPCSTTLWTIKKESGQWRWAVLAALLPTAVGTLLCLCAAAVARLLGVL